MAGQHSTFGPSSAKRIMLCPASYRLHTPQTSSYAITGSAAHVVHEDILKYPKVSPTSYIGRVITIKEEDGDYDVEVDMEMLNAVMESTDRIKDIINDIESFGEEALEFVETRVDISFWTPIKDQFGTSDYCALAVQAKHLYIIDYKHGAGVVLKAKRNVQLSMYALGMLQKLMWNEGYEIEKITLIIHQPNADNFDRWDVDRMELLEFGGEIRTQLKQALLEDAPFGPSGEACQFCGHKAVCPALAAKVQAAYSGDFDNLDEHITEIDFVTLPVMNTKEVSDESLSLAWQHRKLVEMWLEAVKTECEHRMLHGQKVADLKLVKGRNSYSFRNERETLKFLEGHLPKKEILNVSMYSPSVLKKKLPKAVREELEPYIRKKEGRPTVVHVSDKREEYLPYSEDFENLALQDSFAEMGFD